MSSNAAPATLASLHREVRRRLTDAGIESAALDARLLVEHFSGTTQTQAIAEPERAVDAPALVAIDRALARRVAGEPVHRILGYREFYGLRLSLSPETLEPRPDTETLVEAVLPFVKDVAAREGECRILDLGTGSGAIALALLDAVPGAVATGVDVSDDALTTAAGNAERLGLTARFTPFNSDWFASVSGRYHVIASNPPYIRSDDIRTLQVEVCGFDPLRALDGGKDGLEVYRLLASGAAGYLEAGGVVAVEIGDTQKSDVTALFEQGGFLLAEALRDLAGNDRVLMFKTRQDM